MKRVALATVILGAMALTARAQTAREHSSTPAPQTRPISGRVIADDTGDPVVNARVTLVITGPAAPVVLTDHDGRFTVTAPSTRVTIVANKSGYSRHEATANATDQSIDIRLSRGAAVSGRVVDEFGDPIMGARVFVEKPSTQSDGFSGDAATTTDDRGEYRLGSLQAGAFYVAVSTMGGMVRRDMGGGAIAMFPSTNKTYYPAASTQADAERLQLQPGDEKSGTDIVARGGQSIGPAMMIASSPIPPRAPADPARNTGIIRGRVVSTDGRPVPRAQVRTFSRVVVAAANGSGTMVQPRQVMVTTDDEGRYELSELPAGSFRIGAMKVGYSLPDDLRPLAVVGLDSGVAVELADGQTRERVDITLARWGSMTGHVFDELGDPLQGVSVQLLQVRYQGGRRRLVGAGGASNLTDDLGRFRIYGVAPGQYILSAIVGGVQTAELPGYTRSYFPGTPNASEAQFVRMALSQEHTGVDFSMAREKTATISGTLLNAAGEPSTSGSVRLLPSQRSGSVTSVAAGARLMKDGKFEFPNVTPGQYVIQVDRGRRNPATEGEFGTLPVSVDGTDITDLVLQTSTGSSISGRVTFETFLGTQMPKPGQLDLSPVPIDPDLSPAVPGSAEVHPDWSFEIHGVNGPRRLLLQRGPAEWTLKEIRVNGIEATDRPLAFGTSNQSLTDVEVVMTDRINTVSGAIVDDRARPAAGARAIVFPMDRDRWYPASRFLRVAAAGADGAIALAGLPAGSYYAAAVATLPADGDDAWQEPAYLESLVGRAATFTLGEGQKQMLNLKLP